MIDRCVCGHTDQPHLDEGGEWIWCWECYVEDWRDPPEPVCRTFISRVPGWDYVRS